MADKPRAKKALKTQPKDLLFYCDVCARQFRILRDDPRAAGKTFTVACPTCGRRARVERQPDGSIQIVHKEHVLICPPLLNQNPLIVALVYLFVLIFVASVFGAIAHLVKPWLCPVVFGFAVFSVMVIGTIQLAASDKLNDKFVALMRIFAKAFPTIMGKRPHEGKIISA